MSVKSYPYKWRPVNEDGSRLQAYLASEDEDSNAEAVQHASGSVGSGLTMSKMFVDLGINKQIYNMEVRSDDIWILTYPKCGTNWTAEIVWSLINHSSLNSEGQDWNLLNRVPFLEFGLVVDPQVREELSRDPTPFESRSLDDQIRLNPIKFADNCKSPRVFRTHLPISHLPPGLLDKAKVIYVCRNPKDQVVSWWHHMRLFGAPLSETVEEYALDLIEGSKHDYGYFRHLKEHWPLRNHANFKFFWYEEMHDNFVKYLDELQKFTGHTLMGEDHRDQLVARSGINRMRQQSAETAFDEDNAKFYQTFFRKGKVSDWKHHLQPGTAQLFDQWVMDQLKDSGIKLYDGDKK